MWDKTSAAPFLHSADTTQLRMLDAAIALLPAVAGALWFFGPGAFWRLLIALGGCLLLEWAAFRAQKKPDALRDLSAVVTGLLVGLLLPGNCPWWGILLADFVAIIPAKALFGGLGKNLLNPAAAGCAALLVIPALWPEALRTVSGHFLMGYTGGSPGEASSLLLLVGACYLAVRGLFPGIIALCYACFALLTGALLPGCDAMAILAWGGSFLCAIFLGADPVTTPMTVAGKAAFGALCGIACTLAAYYGFGLPGACLGVLALNLLSRMGSRCLPRLHRQKAQSGR